LKRIWLKKLMKKNNLNQFTLAQEANITSSHVSYIISGKRRPSPEVAKRIAKVLGIESEWYRLLEQEGEEGDYGQLKEKQSPAVSPIETKAYSS